MEVFLHTTNWKSKHVKHNKQVKWKRTESYSSSGTTGATCLPPLTSPACLPPIHLLLKAALVLL
jgi:hypothetical protein